METHTFDILAGFHGATGNLSGGEDSNLVLERRGLLLEPGCFEVIDDVGDPPVGRVWQLTVLDWAVGGAGVRGKGFIFLHVHSQL